MYTYNVIIKDVIDGDTVKVDIDLGFDMWIKDENVRLFGIDAPESRTSDEEERIFGNLAKETVKKFLPVGEKFQMNSEEFDKGKFGRVLAIFIARNEEGIEFNLNDYLVDNRLAVVYNGSLNREQLVPFHAVNREFLRKEGKV